MLLISHMREKARRTCLIKVLIPQEMQHKNSMTELRKRYGDFLISLLESNDEQITALIYVSNHQICAFKARW